MSFPSENRSYIFGALLIASIYVSVFCYALFRSIGIKPTADDQFWIDVGNKLAMPAALISTEPLFVILANGLLWGFASAWSIRWLYLHWPIR